MALQMTIKTNSGYTVSDAYLRVSMISGNKENVTAFLKIYVNQEASNSLPHVEERIFTFTPNVDDDAPRWDKQTYEYLKTTDEFAEAVDV